jgi:hypothetical protein
LLTVIFDFYRTLEQPAKAATSRTMEQIAPIPAYEVWNTISQLHSTALQITSRPGQLADIR